MKHIAVKILERRGGYDSANNPALDQIASQEQSDLGLRCLPFRKHFQTASSVSAAGFVLLETSL